MLAGEFGIVYKGCLTGQYTDEIVAIKTLKGEQKYQVVYLNLCLLSFHCGGSAL